MRTSRKNGFMRRTTLCKRVIQLRTFLRCPPENNDVKRPNSSHFVEHEPRRLFLMAVVTPLIVKLTGLKTRQHGIRHQKQPLTYLALFSPISFLRLASISNPSPSNLWSSSSWPSLRKRLSSNLSLTSRFCRSCSDNVAHSASPETEYYTNIIIWGNIYRICRLGRPYSDKPRPEVLKMLPNTAGREQHFQVRGHSCSLYGPTLSRIITY